MAVQVLHSFYDKYNTVGPTAVSFSGLMKYLGKGTTGKIVEDSDDKLSTLLRTFRQNLQNKYNRYAYAFFGCELLNLVSAELPFGQKSHDTLERSGPYLPSPTWPPMCARPLAECQRLQKIC